MKNKCKHELEDKIIDYHPQSEPKWVTEFGYRRPIREYTCKLCKGSWSDKSGSWSLLMYLLPEEFGLE